VDERGQSVTLGGTTRFILSIHTFITVLVVATVLPFLFFSGHLVRRAATSEQELIVSTVRDTVQGAAGDVKRRLDGVWSLAQTIADARMLQIADLAQFQNRWGHVADREGLTTILYDTSGQQLVNTAYPFGSPLPSEPEAVRRVVATGEATITDLTRDAISGKPTVSILIPVRRDGKIVYVSSLQIMSAIASVMTEQVLPPKQIAYLTDRAGIILYRTSDPERFIGARPPAEFPRDTEARQLGSLLTNSLDGSQVYVAYRRVEPPGWTLAVSIPYDILIAPVSNSLYRTLATALAMLLLAAVAAWTLGRSLARSVAGLSRLADTLGTGAGKERPVITHVREVNAVAAAMLSAEEALRAQTDQRERVTDALKAEIAGRERAEQQLRQSQKMEAIGQLTGGLAHDFNNLLAIIVGSLDILRDRWSEDQASRDLAEDALNAALHGADLTSQMLAFARRQPLAPERSDINEVIRSFVRLLRRTLGEDILINLRLADDLWPVLVDRAQLEAAITNLATNARHAMPAGGQLSIGTRNTSLDEDYASTHAEVVPGDYVVIEISDTGTGIPRDVIDRIFEPFFTTKEPGQGTGLGLAMVFGFLKQSGGHIAAYSEPGVGTTFRLYLPPVAGAVSTEQQVTSPPVERGHGQVILAVEDNAGLRRVLVRQLTLAGYRTVEAATAREALIVLQDEAAIDLLLTDIVMPGGMNGYELARIATGLRPGLKIMLTSGFSERESGGADIPPATPVLRKPYQQAELLRLVHETLER
jgi:signal transduction histidine kinase